MKTISLLQYVVLPTRRSTAEAFQILISHAFGDAGSPYLIGLVCMRNWRVIKPLIISLEITEQIVYLDFGKPKTGD